MPQVLILTILFFSFTTAANTSLVSFLSQKTNEIRQIEACAKATTRETDALLNTKQSCRAVPLFQQNLKNLDEANEQIFFNTAARKQIESLDCLLEQTNQFTEKQSTSSVQVSRQKLVDDYVMKAKKIWQIQKELQPIDDELADMERSEVTSPMAEVFVTTYVDEKRRQNLRDRQKKLNLAIESIIASTWQGGNYMIRARLLEESKKKDFSPEKFNREFAKSDGPQSFNDLLSKMRTETLTQKTALAGKAKGTPLSQAHFELNDKDKINLFKNQNWLKNSANQSEADTAGMMCRLNGRYGQGRDRFYSAVEIGAGIGLTLLPGGLYLAAGRGLIALQAARTLAVGAAVGLSTTALAVTYEKQCPQSAMQVSMQLSCQTPEKNLVSEIEHGNCALDVALAALDIPFPELKTVGLLVGSMKAGGVTKKVVSGLERIDEASPFVNPQIEIWNARAAGQLTDAEKIQSSMIQKLQKGKMTLAGQAPVGKTRPFFVDLGDGVEGVWKPAQGLHANANAEVAASKIDQFLGTDVVPLTVHRKFGEIDGSLQLKASELQVVALPDNPDSLSMFDYLIGNIDRHDENYLLSRNNKVVAIDHGKAFVHGEQIFQIEDLEKKIDLLGDIKLKQQKNEKLLQEKLSQGINEKDPQIIQLKKRLEQNLKLEDHVKKDLESFARSVAMPKEVVDRLRTASKDTWKKTVGKDLTAPQIEQLMIRQQHLLNLVDRTEGYIGTAFYPSRAEWPIVKPIKP